MKPPLDSFPYDQDPDSRPIGPDTVDGLFVYAQDENGIIWVLPDGPHRHPKVLGQARSASYAGDLSMVRGKIRDVTNLSGTIQFDDEQGLHAVGNSYENRGWRSSRGRCVSSRPMVRDPWC